MSLCWWRHRPAGPTPAFLDRLYSTRARAPHAGLFDASLPLSVLEAGFCGLTGELPAVSPAAAAQSQLHRIDMRGNALSGTVPASWASFPGLGCLQLSSNLALCGFIPDGLPCFDTLGTSLGEWWAGADARSANISQDGLRQRKRLTTATTHVCAGSTCASDTSPPHSFPGGLRNVTCWLPQSLGCMPAEALSIDAANLNRVSGWTPDARGLQAVAAALQLPPSFWPSRAPCANLPDVSVEAALLGPGAWQEPASYLMPPPSNSPSLESPPPPSPSPAPAPGGTVAGPAQPDVNRGLPWGTFLGYTCNAAEVNGWAEHRVSTLDLTGLVQAGRLPAFNLRLVPEMGQLAYLQGIRASGFPLQGASGLASCAGCRSLAAQPLTACLSDPTL
jgi:hypothetical protein